MKENQSEFLLSGYGGVNLKYIFDHMRNIGICAAIILSGIFYIKNSEDESLRLFNEDPAIVGVIVMVFGGFLAVLNFMQVVWLINPGDTLLQKSIRAVVSLPLYLFTSYLMIGYIRAM